MNKNLISYLITGILISTPLCPNWIKTPENLHFWLTENFTYQAEEEGEDYWKKGFETVRDKGGDCEDSMLLVYEILSKLGYEVKKVLMFDDEKPIGHAICVLKQNNKYTYYSNFYYFSKNKYSSVLELIKNEYPETDEYQYVYFFNKIGRMYRVI